MTNVTNDAWYNTKQGISGSLVSFEDFRKMVDARHEAYYKRKEDLQEFYVMGRWSMDRCGNTMRITDEFVPKEHIPDIDDVLAVDEFWDVIEKYDRQTKPNVLTREERNDPDFSYQDNTRPYPTSVGFSMPSNLPPPKSKCKLCKGGWTIDNCYDVIVEYDYDDERFICYHKNCFVLEKTIDYETQFQGAFRFAGFKHFHFKAIENEYCKCYRCTPWYNVETIYGCIKIGWRKRVINIDYSDLKVSPDFSKEDVTKGEGYIHAWGWDKAEEYLRMIRRELK